jgi:hypothetical protein
MKVFLAYFQEYEDRCTVGVFSTSEMAQEALTHYYHQKIADEGYFYYSGTDGYIDEFTLDEYHAKHLSPLAKALE